MKNSKRVTIEELAMMVANGFQDMVERFNRIEERLDRLESAQIEREVISAHERRIARIENTIFAGRAR